MTMTRCLKGWMKIVGDNRKLVDAVVSDLKSLKPIKDGDNRNFVKMVEKIERCWLDLKRSNLEDEMNTASKVSCVEKVLPSIKKREWVMCAEIHRNSPELFKWLMDFLLKEKRVLEYLDSNLRAGSISQKTMCHSAVGEVKEDGKLEEIIKAVRKLGEDQSEIRQCITLLTQTVSGLGKNHGRQEGALWQKSKCWLHDSDSHSVIDCSDFKNLRNADKLSVIKQNRVCFNCLKGHHLPKKCPAWKTCNVTVISNQRCGRYHHSLLHDAFSESVVNYAFSLKSEQRVRENSLLMVSRVYCDGLPLSTVWDLGSDITLVRHDTASRLGLKGREVNLSITMGNRTETLSIRFP